MKIEWKCPKCGAQPGTHGEGGVNKCKDGPQCPGFICECEEEDSEADDHGESFTNPCVNAVCYHCSWSGNFPKKPKGLQSWEKKALDAGWTMPEARRKGLGLGN